MLILLEGPEGAGKTTIAKRLTTYLVEHGTQAVYLREPGGDHVSEAIRKVLLDPASEGMDPLAEFFLFQASRAQFVKKVLRNLLEAKYAVVLDRYSLSTMAYQIAGRGLAIGPCVAAIDLATGGIIPAVTFLLMASYETGRARQQAAGKTADRLEAEKRDFHERVITGYRSFASMLPTWGINMIETDGLTEDQVFSRVLEGMPQGA